LRNCRLNQFLMQLMSKLSIIFNYSNLSRVCLCVFLASLVACSEANSDPEKVTQGKARLIYVPQNGPEAALEWIAYEKDLQPAGNSESPAFSEKDLNSLLQEKASEMLVFPAESACELSVEEIRREPVPGSDGERQLHVEYFAFCKSLPESVKLKYSGFFPGVRTTQLYWTHSGKKEMVEIPESGEVELRKP